MKIEDIARINFFFEGGKTRLLDARNVTVDFKYDAVCCKVLYRVLPLEFLEMKA